MAHAAVLVLADFRWKSIVIAAKLYKLVAVKDWQRAILSCNYNYWTVVCWHQIQDSTIWIRKVPQEKYWLYRGASHIIWNPWQKTLNSHCCSITGYVIILIYIGLWSLMWLSNGCEIMKSALILVQMWSIIDPLSWVGIDIICENWFKTSNKSLWEAVGDLFISMLKSPVIIMGASSLQSFSNEDNLSKNHFLSSLCGERYTQMT